VRRAGCRGHGTPRGPAVGLVAARPRAALGRPRHFREQPGWDFDGAVADPEVVAAAWQTWRDEVAFADQFVAEAPGLDITGDTGRGEDEPELISLRQVMVHMIEEYARHMGHADFLRERIDGRVGQ
jgi:Protein of unknown function (DUF664)